MSVAALIQQHGTDVTVLAPADSIGTDGAVVKTYSTGSTLRAFLQPRSASDTEFAGGARMRVGATFYFAGRVAFDTDAILSHATGQYVVRSVRIPIDRPSASANCHTIVEADSVGGYAVTAIGL
jgi:hypothetical protein